MLYTKHGDSEVVFCLLEPVDKVKVDQFLEKFKGFKGKKVIATLETMPPSILEQLDHSIIVWDKDALAHEIGRTHIEKALGEKDHGLVDELIADDFPKMISLSNWISFRMLPWEKG